MKIFRSLLILVSFILGSLIGNAQTAEQATSTLVQLIGFSNDQALLNPETRKLLSGEALEWRMPSFGRVAASPDKIVITGQNRAVGRVQWYGQDNHVADLYFYLTYDGGWKVNAVRRLALTGIIEGAYRHLRTKPSLTPEEREDLANYELLLASDETLRNWFSKNSASMNKLMELARILKKGEFSNRDDSKHPEIKLLMKSLHLTGLDVGDDGNVEFVIGGVTDNTVGFLYSPSNKPPAISAGSYIWVEEVAPKWFLFRTT